MTHEQAYMTNPEYRKACENIVNAFTNRLISYEESWDMMREIRFSDKGETHMESINKLNDNSSHTINRHEVPQ